MNIFDQYGIKEVADVTLYSIHKKQDGSGEVYYVPALYLDTLKISTVEKTAENVWAQGGLGNARLISWDYGKQINVTLEDALCTPASLGLCWNGALSADWKDAEVQVNTDVCCCKNPLTRISRMEKAIYPRQDRENSTVSDLLPRLKTDVVDKNFDLLKISSVVDGTQISGNGIVKNHTYRWKLVPESAVKSVAQVPDRFFDVKGKSYSIDWNRKVSVHSLPTYTNFKDAIIYRINSCQPMVPPMAKIIFDSGVENVSSTGEFHYYYFQEDSSVPVTLGVLLQNAQYKDENGDYQKVQGADERGYTVYDNGIFSIYLSSNYGSDYFLSLIPLDTVITGEWDQSAKAYKYEMIIPYYKVTSAKVRSDIICYSNLLQPYTDLTNSLIGVYAQNKAATELTSLNQVALPDEYGALEKITGYKNISEGDYLAIIVDNNDDYHALIGVNEKVLSETNHDREAFAQDHVLWYHPTVAVDVSQFKGLDMWLRFQSINEMIYFMITKYENDIQKIIPATIYSTSNFGIETKDRKQYNIAVNQEITTVEENKDEESKKAEGRLWAYVNPRTMAPYSDDYWFHQGEPIYVKSLTIAPRGKKIKGNKITVRADQWPGMYMMVGETYIRNRDTGEDERMQIKFPLCKVKSDQTLTLEAEGDPTTFNLDLEVARPASGVMMELTSYEVAERLLEGDNGCFYAVDGSTQVLSE